MTDHTISFVNERGEYRVRVDAPGVAAVSAPIEDRMAFVILAARELGLTVDTTDPDHVIVAANGS